MGVERSARRSQALKDSPPPIPPWERGGRETTRMEKSIRKRPEGSARRSQSPKVRDGSVLLAEANHSDGEGRAFCSSKPITWKRMEKTSCSSKPSSKNSTE